MESPKTANIPTTQISVNCNFIYGRYSIQTTKNKILSALKPKYFGTHGNYISSKYVDIPQTAFWCFKKRSFT